MPIKEEMYDEVGAEVFLSLSNAIHSFKVEYHMAETSPEDQRDDKKITAVLNLLSRGEMALEGAKLRLAALSPTWRGVN